MSCDLSSEYDRRTDVDHCMTEGKGVILIFEFVLQNDFHKLKHHLILVNMMRQVKKDLKIVKMLHKQRKASNRWTTTMEITKIL